MSKVNWLNLLRLRWKVGQAVPDSIGNENALIWLRNEKELKKVVNSFLAPDIRLPLTVYVDYSMSFKQMVIDAGLFCDNPQVNERSFPISGSGVQEFRVRPIPLIAETGNDLVRTQLLEMHLNLSSIERMFAFWKKFPKKIVKEPLICLGSPKINTDGSIDYPYIKDGVLDLCRMSPEGKWTDNSWVLGEVVNG